jgi:hypothetical protein
MSEYSRISILQSRTGLLIVAIPTGLLVACSDRATVTEYSLKKVNAKDNYEHERLPLNPTTYRIGNNTVVSETVGILYKYEKCTTMSADDWECQYSDQSGSFGFRNGAFWRIPEWSDTKVVSRLEYNQVRCEWALKSKHESKFWGTARCIFGWR